MLLWILLATVPMSYCFLFPSFGGGGSCGCPCPPQPVCAPPPVCPPIQACQPVQYIPPPPPPSSCCATCGCNKRQRREAPILSNGTFIVQNEAKINNQMRQKREDILLNEVVKVDAKCNSEELRDIIISNIDRVTSVAKKRIQEEADKQLEGRFNVICARGDFSYITNTELFCQETVGDVTCFVFKQLSDVVRSRLL